MLEIQGNIDHLFSQQDLMDDEKAKRYFQLQNRYLALKKTIEFKNTNTTRRDQQRCSRITKHTRFFDLQRNTRFKTGSHLTKTLSRTIYPTTTVKSKVPDPSSGANSTTSPEIKTAADSFYKLPG